MARTTKPEVEALNELPLEQLRARLLSSVLRRSVLARVLAQLREDPRAGARELAEALARRHQRSEIETGRVASLYRADAALRRDVNGALVAGCDEVGMGPLAGPVVAAAVVLPPRPRIPRLDDCKRLTASEREDVAKRVRDVALAFAIQSASVAEIDQINIYRAGQLAMRRAVEGLSVAPALVALDGRGLPELPYPRRAFIGGDARYASIAAASVIAKVHRDALMDDLHREYPDYGFAQHRGYATPEHLAALQRLGATSAHRRSFAPVAQQHAQLELFGSRAAPRDAIRGPSATIGTSTPEENG